MAKDTPLDMDQYRYMFNTSRRPVIPSDIVLFFIKKKSIFFF